jgi:hypothetical protein
MAALGVVLTFFGVTFAVNGQTARQSGGQPAQPWFDGSGLKTGDPFPEISVFDAAGKPFNTRSLKGQYTVLINGCLT